MCRPCWQKKASFHRRVVHIAQLPRQLKTPRSRARPLRKWSFHMRGGSSSDLFRFFRSMDLKRGTWYDLGCEHGEVGSGSAVAFIAQTVSATRSADTSVHAFREHAQTTICSMFACSKQLCSSPGMGFDCARNPRHTRQARPKLEL